MQAKFYLAWSLTKNRLIDKIQMKSRLFLFNIFILLYFLLGFIFYNFASSRPINFIFSLFNYDVSFFIKNKSTQSVEKYINSFDENFFYFLPTLPLALLIILSLVNLKKILFSKNFILFKNEDLDISHLGKYNLNYLNISPLLFDQ